MQKEIVEYIQQIKKSMGEEKYDEAYQLCNKIRLNFPENRRLKRLESEIEEIAYNRNITSVKKDLKALTPLWKEEKYEDLVTALNELLNFVPGYKPVEKKLIKAQKLWKKQLENTKNTVVIDHKASIRAALQNNEYKEAVSLAKQLLQHLPDDKELIILHEKSRDLYINHEITTKQELLMSDKYDKIEMFLKDLLRIHPESKRVKQLIRKIANRESVFLEFAKKDFSYKSFEELIVLYQKKKYDKVVEGVKELIALEPENFKFLELLSKAEKRFKKQLNKEATEKVIALTKQFKKRHKKFPKQFIRL